MPQDLVAKTSTTGIPLAFAGRPFPKIILAVGIPATRRFIEFFAAHESPRTTKLYGRRQDGITLDEIERIII